MKCLQLIKSADFLSNEVKLIINKHETRMKTIVGGSLSILSILIMFTFSICFFIQFVNKTQIFVTSSTDTSDFSNNTESKSYPFLIRLTDKHNKPFKFPETIYKLSFKYWYGGSNTTQEVVEQIGIDIKMEKCDLAKHFSNYRYLFSNMDDLDTFFCAAPRPFNMTIYGKYGAVTPFGYYHFYVSLCNDRSDCLPLPELTSITEHIYLDFRTVGYSINPKKHDPKIAKVHSDRHMLSSTVYKRIWVYFDQITYVTDSGFFFPSESTETFFRFSSMRYDIDLRDKTLETIPGTFLTMSLLNTGDIRIFNRHYFKIQDYLATIGGIIKFVNVVAMMLNYYFSKNSYNLKLINEVHIIQSMTKIDKDTNPNSISIIKKLTPLKNITPKKNSKLHNLFPSTTDFKNDMNESKEQLDVNQFKKKVIVMEKMKKWYFRFIPIQCFPAKSTSIFIKCLDKLHSSMNIANILMKIEDNSIFFKEMLFSDKNPFLQLKPNQNVLLSNTKTFIPNKQSSIKPIDGII